MKKPKKSTNNKISLKPQFKEALSYTKESLPYIYTVIILFILSAILGYFLSPHLSFLDQILKDLISKTQNLNSIELIFFILQNNILACLIVVLSGIFLGISPIFNTISNGVILGYVLNKTIALEGPLIALRLFPHGIFELPAVFISLGLGIKLGAVFFSHSKDKWIELKLRFYKSINTFLVIILPLLIIAAIIEGLLIAFIG